jgi:glycosyltransferase involved in cell wall biosynthesis
MKILHIAETIRGGPATVLSEIIPRQVLEFGEENVGVIIPRQQVQDLENISKICIHGFERRSRILGIPFLIAKAISVIRRFEPDIIHIHSTVAGLLIRPLLVLTQSEARIVYCAHGWSFDMDMSPILQSTLERIEWVLSLRTDKVIAISEYEYGAGLRIGNNRSKLELIRNGICSSPPPVAKASWDDPRLHVLFIGRLDKQKGVDILLDAVAELGARVAVRIVGDSVVNSTKKLKIPDHVKMMGWLCPTGVSGQLAACDLVVMPSRWEGFGLVAIEAMRAGKPVVATRVGGLASIVVDGVTGSLVTKESVAQLSEAIISRSASEWPELGLAGRKRFLQLYTSDRMHRILADVYYSLRVTSEPVLASGKSTSQV